MTNASPMRLAVHGGAGDVPSAQADPAFGRLARRGCEAALAAGWRVLADGGGALDAVIAAVVVLEDCEALNAGRGSVAGATGLVEMDAAVMEGAGRRAGAVALLRGIAHPVLAARAVMEDGRHVLLAGGSAEAFARDHGLATVDPAVLEAIAARRRATRERPTGTVGAVACDAAGHLATATSTGGTPGKRPGRLSDSALVGAGTWADDAICAVSATGEGEGFIRSGFAHEVDALRRHAGLSLAAACERALAAVTALGFRGGCIAIDPDGRLAMPFTTRGMLRGWIDGGGARLAIHPEEALDPS
jgi:isoaspartyl peptidase/L-asparaginase-like protein (Ntn-hydrolase superfamily)